MRRVATLSRTIWIPACSSRHADERVRAPSAAGAGRNCSGTTTAIPTRYVTASTTNAPRGPHAAIAPAASSGPNAIDDIIAAPNSALARRSCSSSTSRGASAENAGSLAQRVRPVHAPSTTSCAKLFEKTSASAMHAAMPSATISVRRGPNRSTGTPPSGPNNAAGNDHDSDNNAISPGVAWKRYAA